MNFLIYLLFSLIPLSSLFCMYRLEICHLKLIHLDCSFNRLIQLPLNLREMVSLIELNVDNNPLESPPASVNEI
jgi:hypothetical protein